jgi:hypothetical protein
MPTAAQINAAREANIAAGRDPYSGAGARNQTPATAPSSGSGQATQAQLDQIAELQRKIAIAQEALRVKNEIERLKAIKPDAPAAVLDPESTTAAGVENAANIANNPAAPRMAYKDTDAYKSLSAEEKDAIDLAYGAISVGGEIEAKQLSDAIKNAVAIADPYYAAQMNIFKGEFDAKIAEQKGDYESKYRIIKETRDRLAEDVSADSSNLTLEQQADMATVVREFDEDILAIADEAADKGLTFATGARSKILADKRRAEQMQDVVQSSSREYNYKINQLKIKAQRGDEDAAAELAELETSNTLALQGIGRAAETVLGSANIPAITGYTPVGGVIGSIEEDKRRAVLSDVGSMMQLNQGF